MCENKFACLLPSLTRKAKLSGAALFILLFSFACTGHEAFTDEGDMDMEEGIAEVEEEVPTEIYDGKLLAQVVFDTVDYIVPQRELMQPFIREFGDGTVVNQIMIRKVQETKDDEPAYYLVGLGMRDGAFRSMALTLDVSSNNSLYLSSKGAKHICQASAGCNFCYFTFSGNNITGCECDSRSPNSTCTHKFTEGNTLLQDVQLRNQRN